MVINGTQITYPPETAHIAREKVKKFPYWSLLVQSSSIEPKRLAFFRIGARSKRLVWCKTSGSNCKFEPARGRWDTLTISRITVDKRNMTIMARKKKYIARAILFTCIALLFMTSSASAQNDKKERGYNGRITIKELLSKFKHGETVKGCVIDGDNIIKIIRRTRYAIKIEDSVIKGGLDFHKLPKIPLDKIKLPKDWDKEKRDEFIEKRRTFDYPFIHNVKNEIQVTNSEIQSKKTDVPLVQAMSTFFYNVANFSKTTFSGEADFFGATFSGRAYFSGAIFSEGAAFSWATFRRGTLFLEATFSGLADFFNATFSGLAIFSGTTFSGKANFYETTFSGGTYFNRATFCRKADFKMASFLEEVTFLAATFNGLAHFLEATFSKSASFSGATFSGLAIFSKTTFSSLANFSRTTFNGLVYFLKITINGKADFSGVTFHEPAYFEGSRVNNLFLDATLFTKYADFREMMIGRLNYKCTSPAIVKGRMDFRNSSISEMHFQDIIFENDVDFSDVTFGIPQKEGKTDGTLATVFRFVTFESDAYFIRTGFHNDTAFERIKFKGDANFTDVNFKGFKRGDQKKFSLSYLTFKHLLLSIDDLPDIQHWVRRDKDRIQSFVDMEDDKANKTGEENLQPLTKVLYSMEDVFHSQNNLSDANKTHYYRKLMELEDARKEATFWRRFWKELQWIFWGIPCGYATSWEKIVLWSGGFYLFFVILYNTGGKLTKTYQEEEDEFRLRLFVLPIKYLFHESEVDFVPNEYLVDHKEGWGKFISALKFSMVIFFKIGYIDTKISGKILRTDAKYFVWAEWVIGYWLLTALVVTLSNTLPIVHRLISGIF